MLCGGLLAVSRWDRFGRPIGVAFPLVLLQRRLLHHKRPAYPPVDRGTHRWSTGWGPSSRGLPAGGGLGHRLLCSLRS